GTAVGDEASPRRDDHSYAFCLADRVGQCLRSAAKCSTFLPLVRRTHRSAPAVRRYLEPEQPVVWVAKTAPKARPPRRAEPESAGAELHLPKSPPSVVLRPRLFDLLDTGASDCALTLVSGPPGAGKTVLLTSWLRERPHDASLAWVSLREADRAPFWQQVLDAVRPS